MSMGEDNPPQDRPELAPGGDPFDGIVDDDSPRQEAADWARREILAGRGPDPLIEELVGGGWAPEDAEIIVEQVRKETRVERGVMTREQVAAVTGRHYRGAMRLGWFSAFPGFAMINRLIHAVAGVLALRKLRRNRR